MNSIKSGKQNNTKKLSYLIWTLIVAGNVTSAELQEWECFNGQIVNCVHIDFTNLIFGGIAAILIVFNWSALATSKNLHPKWKWSNWAAIAACIFLLIKGIHGGGCECTVDPFPNPFPHHLF